MFFCILLYQAPGLIFTAIINKKNLAGSTDFVAFNQIGNFGQHHLNGYRQYLFFVIARYNNSKIGLAGRAWRHNYLPSCFVIYPCTTNVEISEYDKQS